MQELYDTWSWGHIKTALSAMTYIENVVSKYESLIRGKFKKYKSAMEMSYHKELKDSESLNAQEHLLYQGMIILINWRITFGRFDIAYAAVALVCFIMVPKQGRLKAMCRLFGYL